MLPHTLSFIRATRQACTSTTTWWRGGGAEGDARAAGVSVQANVLEPTLLGRRLNLHPVVVLFSLVFWNVRAKFPVSFPHTRRILMWAPSCGSAEFTLRPSSRSVNVSRESSVLSHAACACAHVAEYLGHPGCASLRADGVSHQDCAGARPLSNVLTAKNGGPDFLFF